MKLFKQAKLAALTLVCVSMSTTIFAGTSLSALNTSSLKTLVAKAPTPAIKEKVATTLNAKLPLIVEPGATLKKVEYSNNFKLTVFMTDKTANKYSSDETDSLNRFVVEKIHPFYCGVFKQSKAAYKPDLYVDLVDKKGQSYFGSSESYNDVCQ